MDGPNMSWETGNPAGTKFLYGTAILMIIMIVKSTILPAKKNLPIRMIRFLDIAKNVLAATVNLEFWWKSRRQNSEINLLNSDRKLV